MPALQLGPVHLVVFLYALIVNFLAGFGLMQPAKPVSKPKMMIEELRKRHEKLRGIAEKNEGA